MMAVVAVVVAVAVAEEEEEDHLDILKSPQEEDNHRRHLDHLHLLLELLRVCWRARYQNRSGQ